MVSPALIPLMRTPRLPVVDWTDAPRRFKWTRPFRRKTKSGFCACAITFQTQSTPLTTLRNLCPTTKVHGVWVQTTFQSTLWWVCTIRQELACHELSNRTSLLISISTCEILSDYHTDTRVLITALRHIIYPNDVKADGKSVNTTQCHIKRSGRLRLKCGGTRSRTGGEVKGKLANGVGSQYPSHYLGTRCIQYFYRWCAHLGCQ